MTYINTNFYQQIALGRYSNIVSWSKLGYNPNIGTSEEDVLCFRSPPCYRPRPTFVSSCWRLPLAASAQQYCVDF